MIIKRIQVEEGFLDGLDIAFAPGLNVLIGPRGTGKTSVIESEKKRKVEQVAKGVEQVWKDVGWCPIPERVTVHPPKG
jgi:predicted AAA+ superfamily ATPase